MAAHPLILLDGPTQLGNQLLTYFNDLFTLPVAIAALVLAFVLALLGLGISYVFLRPKEICSMVCSIHFLMVIGALLAGLLGGFGIIDATLKDNGSLIMGAGVALLVLAIPIWILVKSFDWVVLSNKHARRHRDLRTKQDKRVRSLTVFLVPLLLGLLLVGVGAVVGSQHLTPVQEVFTLLGILWVLALGTEIIAWLRARSRRRKLKQLGSGPALDRAAAAKLWTSGLGSYRIGRGETEALHWETFTERVVITEELLLEEDREIDLVTVEEQETRASGLILAGAGAAGSAGVAHGMRVGAAPHLSEHRPQRQKQPGRFRQRWGLLIFMLIVAVIAIIVAASSGISFNSFEGQGVALAFLIPVLFLLVNRFRRDHERAFASEMVEKIATVQPIAVATPARPAFGAASAAAAPASTQAATPAAGGASAGQAAAPVLRPTRPTPVIPPVPPPVIPPKEPAEPPTMPAPGAAPAGPAHANPDIADDTLVMRPEAIPPAPVSAGDTDSAEVSQALGDATYPATAGALLAHARRKKASRRIITWLETIEETTVLTSVVMVVERYRQHRAAARAEDEEPTITVAPGAAKGKASASSRISITEFQHYLKGVHYPATRARLLEQANKNGATANMIARLEELDASYEFGSVGEVMRGYVFYHYLSDASYPASRDQLLAHARSKKASRSLILWLESETVTTTFVTSIEAMRSFARFHLNQEEIEQEVVETVPSAAVIEEDEEVTLAPPPPGPRVTTSIKITDFQRYLHGIHYPVNREQLLERARENHAPANMLARLGELDETYTFHGVTEVMRGYVFYHYLRNVRYPASRDQLLTEARTKKATRSLLTWLEHLHTTTSFSSATEAMQSYAHFKASEAEAEEEEEEEEED